MPSGRFGGGGGGGGACAPFAPLGSGTDSVYLSHLLFFYS